MLLYGRIFFIYIIHIILVLNVVRPLMKAFSSSILRQFPYVQHFHHSLNFASITRLMNGIGFIIVQRFDSWFYFSSIGLIFRQDVSSFYSSKDWIVLVGYIYPWILNILSCNHFSCPLVERRRLRVHLTHLSEKYALSLFLRFILISRKAYRRYILASRDFIRLGLLAFLID